MFVEEANLSVNVSILRKALGEQPDGQPTSRRWRAGATVSWAAVTSAAAAPRTLAVPPFRPLAANEADEPLARMADAFIARLAATAGLAYRPNGGHPPLRLARHGPARGRPAAAVDAVVDGRFRERDARLLVSVQLLPADGPRRCGPSGSKQFRFQRTSRSRPRSPRSSPRRSS